MLRTARRYHAYWLVPVEEPNPSYLNLLITDQPVEKVDFAALRRHAGHGAGDLLALSAIWVRSYMRDSLWNTDFHPFKPAAEVRAVSPQQGTLSFWDAQERRTLVCRYQEAPLADLARLLAHPEGTEPIHRLCRPETGAEALIAELLPLVEQCRRSLPEVG